MVEIERGKTEQEHPQGLPSNTQLNGLTS